jgi:hypothetical protein
MKSYNTPALVQVGTVVELTQGNFPGTKDASGAEVLVPAGSVGFNL